MIAESDWTIDQGWSAYTAEQHALWDRLYARQRELLKGRACDAFLRGLDALALSAGGIPDFSDLSERLRALTGWSVVAVPGLVPDEVFFDHLANRRFVSGNFIRTPEQMDYLEEPDVFHDVFGHVPLLTDPVFADYMQEYGRGGLRAAKGGAIEKLARLYWYTVEFGLLREAGALRLYGAGIVSSFSETSYALESAVPRRIEFDLERVMRTAYKIDDFQQSYFVIDSFDQLLDRTLHTDFAPIYRRLADAPAIEPGVVLPGERLVSPAA